MWEYFSPESAYPKKKKECQAKERRNVHLQQFPETMKRTGEVSDKKSLSLLPFFSSSTHRNGQQIRQPKVHSKTTCPGHSEERLKKREEKEREAAFGEKEKGIKQARVREVVRTKEKKDVTSVEIQQSREEEKARDWAEKEMEKLKTQTRALGCMYTRVTSVRTPQKADDMEARGVEYNLQ